MASGQNVTFDVNARDKTKRGLLSAQKNLNKTGKEADKLAGRFRNVARATVIMEGPLGGTAGRLSAMATMLNSVGLGTIALGVGITALTAGVVKSMIRFAEFEKQQFKIQQLLETTNGAAGLTANELSEMAERIGISTLESIEGVREAQAILLTFKGIGVDSFESVMEMAANMSVVTGQELKQSVLQLGKALEDPATNMGTLRRNGVSFTNSQKDMIVAMKESGDAAGAQAAMLKLLEGQMGGTGVAAAGGLAGAADTLAERWGLMLEKFAESGAGQTATKMLNAMASGLEKVGLWLDPTNAEGLLQVNEDIAVNQEELIGLKEDESIFDHFRIKLLEREYIRLLDKREVIQDTLFWEREEVRLAREKGEETQKQIALTQELARAEETKAKTEKEKAKSFGKESGASSAFVQKLIDEEQKFATSLLAKSQQEDQFNMERMLKLEMDLELGLITKQEFQDAEQAAFALHQSKLTEIHAEEKAKQADAEKDLSDMQISATKSALSDIGSLMSSSSKKLFKVGQAAAIANALVNTYQAVTKTMASVPYPFNIPLAVAQAAAGLVQVQKIKSQKVSAAKEFGGSVIGGRQYLVGERGPELFTPPRTGNITNNKTLNNSGSNSNIINVTTIVDRGEEYLDTNMEKIWNGMLDKMNENGMRFA